MECRSDGTKRRSAKVLPFWRSPSTLDSYIGFDSAPRSADHTRMAPRDPDRARSPYPLGTIAGHFSNRDKAWRALWYVVAATLFRWSFRRADRWRALLLRGFGAQIGRRCLIRRTARVEIPWNLSLGDDAMLGEFAIVYNLGPIAIGDRTIISQYVHLCGGSHDFATSDMTLLRIPITIGADVWIAADAFVGPGVTVGDGTIVGARSSVFKDLPPRKICFGNPARVVRDREFDTNATAAVASPIGAATPLRD